MGKTWITEFLVGVAAILSMSIPLAEAVCRGTLKVGSRGSCVEEVQRAVGADADGIFGPKTKAAVMEFQSLRGLVVDGIVGRNTWAAIHGTYGSSNDGFSNDCGCSYEYATGVSGGPTQGAINLANYLHQHYGSRQEIYSPRRIGGSGRWSLHAEGRAVDHYASGKAGWDIFNHMTSIACQNGIQEVIYGNKIWTISGESQYTKGGHDDHVHIGLNRCGALNFNL